MLAPIQVPTRHMGIVAMVSSCTVSEEEIWGHKIENPAVNDFPNSCLLVLPHMESKTGCPGRVQWLQDVIRVTGSFNLAASSILE